MIVGLTGPWKHPVGYFLLNKISASVQAQLIKDCIGLLHHEDSFVTALVFDGTFGNQGTATQLGCIMGLSNIQNWFPHPQIPDAKVHVVFDVCHTIKLMQNMLGDQRVICYEENGTIQRIKWQYIEALNSVQEGPWVFLSKQAKETTHFVDKTQNECKNCCTNT